MSSTERSPSARRSWLRVRGPMIPRLSYVMGAVVMASGAAMTPALVTSMIYQEWDVVFDISVAAFITIAVGFVLWRVFGRSGLLTTKEGFATVGLSWFFMAFFGTLPYLLSGSIGNLTDAFFETASGFTTTGASLVPDPSLLPHGILMWRSTTQWLGGMGIIVLSLAILPLLGVGGVQLARAESPGPEPDRLTPRFRETAKRLWYVYAGLTALEALLLWAGDMNLFQAINHAFTTLSTGGFSTEATSIAEFSEYTKWVIIVFMYVAGVSFALHYRALRKPGTYFKNREYLLYTGMILGAAVIMVGGVWGDTPLYTNITDSMFTSAAMVTTTGFGTADFALWVPALQIFIVGLMFVGGMAGSTAGGIKTYRLGVLTKAASADLRRLIHPRGVFITRFDNKTVPDPIVESVQSFFLFFMFIFMTGTFLMGFIGSTFGMETDIVTSVSATASALGNIGPGLGAVGPTSNYLAIAWPAKWLLSFLMIVGRLEIFPVLLLFTRELWRR